MSDKIGQQIGNYRLIRLLGSGGFAAVYLGQHIYLHNMQVAIKMLHAKVVDEKIHEGFLQEAETIALLKHPNIIRLLDFGIVSQDTTPYLIMDYAPHGTLRTDYPKGSIVQLSSVVIYVKQIASALQYAHDRNLVHRDLKPENLLIGNRGEILLSDFGIAAIAHNTSTLEASNYAGTVTYSAPEQIQGKPRRESDQYSLGIIVYEWLSKEPPFRGTWSEIISQHLGALPKPLHEKIPAIPPAVGTVVMRALAKDPHQRFKSIKAFAAAFEQACLQPSPQQSQHRVPVPSQTSGVSITPKERAATETSVARRVITQPKRALVGLIVLLGLLLSSGITWIGIHNTHIGQGNTHATTTGTRANITTSTAPGTLTAISTTNANNNSYPPFGGTLVLNDPLHDNSKGYGWDEYSDNGQGVACQFEKDGYHAISQQHYVVACHSSTVVSNFTFEVQMEINNGSCGGITFHDDTITATAYHFKVCQDGSYQLYRWDSSSSNPTLASGYSSAIKPGLRQSNLLAVVAINDNFDLYVNHKQIANVSDNTYQQGHIGLRADSPPQCDVIYNNAKLWKL